MNTIPKITPSPKPPEACSHLSSGSRASWRFILLTQGKYAIVDAENYEWLNQWKWYAHKNNNMYYARTHMNIDGNQKTILMHRLILGLKRGEIADHINHIGLDNRIENLRKCTASQNKQNGTSYGGSLSQYKGVSRHRNNWRATITVSKKQLWLGSFKSEIEAAKAYDHKAQELFGEFAHTNF